MASYASSSPSQGPKGCRRRRRRPSRSRSRRGPPGGRGAAGGAPPRAGLDRHRPGQRPHPGEAQRPQEQHRSSRGCSRGRRRTRAPAPAPPPPPAWPACPPPAWPGRGPRSRGARSRPSSVSRSCSRPRLRPRALTPQNVIAIHNAPGTTSAALSVRRSRAKAKTTSERSPNRAVEVLSPACATPPGGPCAGSSRPARPPREGRPPGPAPCSATARAIGAPPHPPSPPPGPSPVWRPLRGLFPAPVPRPGAPPRHQALARWGAWETSSTVRSGPGQPALLPPPPSALA